MPEQYLRIKESEISRGKSKAEAERIAAATYNKQHPGHPMGPNTDYSASTEFTASAPREVTDIYHNHRSQKLDGGATADQAHRHALRMIQNAGWYKSKSGWKRLHADLRDKINIREPVKQPDGTYCIFDIDVFYPNATKGHFFDAERIKHLVENTNRMIGEGGQRPGLLEGHPKDAPMSNLVAMEMGKQFAPVGYGVNWRTNSHGLPGWVKCDLVDVAPEFIERQKSRPLTGLSAGISSDAGSLNERFNHIALLGNSLQSLSRLPRTELSEVFSSTTVCFAAGGTKSLFFHEVKMNPHDEMAEAYASYAAAQKSFSAGEPGGENKMKEALGRIKSCYSSNPTMFSAPDEPLMKQAGHLETQPGEGPEIITEEGPSNTEGQHHDGKHSFSAEEMEDPRIASVLRQLNSERESRRKSEQLLAGAVGKIVRKDFDSEVAELRRNGHELPSDESIAAQFNVCYSSATPKESIASFLGMLKSMPKRHSPAGLGTVLGAAGAAPATGTPRSAQERRSERTGAMESLGVMFSAEDIEFGLKMGDILDAAKSKAN